MEPHHIRYILVRAVSAVVLIVAILYGFGIFKKKQRQKALIAEMKSVCSDSSFYRQFSLEEAQKTLVRGVALIAEGKQLELDPARVINSGIGLEEKYFLMDEDKEPIPIRLVIIRDCLRANYENFLKLGYTTDFHTLQGMKDGKLPALRTGPYVGVRVEIGPIIDPKLSPGIDRVIANLQIRPPRKTGTPMSDVETAAAKQLAKDLSDAGIIEKLAADRIIESLTPKEPEGPLKIKK